MQFLNYLMKSLDHPEKPESPYEKFDKCMTLIFHEAYRQSDSPIATQFNRLLDGHPLSEDTADPAYR